MKLMSKHLSPAAILVGRPATIDGISSRTRSRNVGKMLLPLLNCPESEEMNPNADWESQWRRQIGSPHESAHVGYPHLFYSPAEPEYVRSFFFPRKRFPERFSTNQAPQILSIPETAWINKPANKPIEKDPLELAA